MFQCDVSAHVPGNSQDAVSGGIDPHMFHVDFRTGDNGPGSNKIGCGGNISRHMDFLGSERTAGPDDGRRIFCGDISAKLFQHQFGMVSADMGFCHTGYAVRIQTCQENGGFYLCGSHLCGILHAMEGGAFDEQRRTAISTFACNPGSHLGQGIYNAAHRASLYGSVSGEPGVKMLGGQNPGNEPCGGAAVSRIQCGRRWLQAIQSVPVDGDAALIL